MLSERNHKMVDDSAVQIFVVREDEDACALEGGTGECLRYARVAKKNPALLVAKTVCAWRWPNRRSRPIQADPAHRGLPSFFFIPGCDGRAIGVPRRARRPRAFP